MTDKETQEYFDQVKEELEEKEHEEKNETDMKAVKFMLGSMRGRYIMAQALHYAIEAMSAVDIIYREVSNIKDMEYLQRTLFNDFPDGIFTASKKVNDIFAKQINTARQTDEAKDLQELKDSEIEDD
jgi:hypothetical protein